MDGRERGNRAGDGAGRSARGRGAARQPPARRKSPHSASAGARQASRSCSRRPGPATMLRHWPTDALGVWLVERVAPDETLAHPGDARPPVPRALVSRLRGQPRRARPAGGRRAGLHRRDLEALLRRQPRGRALPVVAAHAALGGRLAAAAAGRQRARTGSGAAARSAGRPRLCRGVADGRRAARDGAARRRFRGAAVPRAGPARAVDRRVRPRPPGRAPVLRGYRTAEEYGAFLDRVLPAP